jgi:hypothetical protein
VRRVRAGRAGPVRTSRRRCSEERSPIASSRHTTKDRPRQRSGRRPPWGPWPGYWPRTSASAAPRDRIGIRGFVPGLQYEGGVLRFLLERGYRLPSPAGLAHNHDRLTSELEDLVAAHDVPVVRFRRDDCKEDIARPYQLSAAGEGRSGLVLVGKAQERTSAWRGFIDESHAARLPACPAGW